MSEYDSIAKDYSEIEELRPERKFFIDPSFLKAVGNVNGKKVLDLACGDGYMGRKLLFQNPKKIVGIDLSKEMIKLAKSKQENKGIVFEEGDIINLGKKGEFHKAIAAFLLHYSKTREELFKMCKNVYKNLKNGGEFITINNNPSSPLIDKKSYGIRVEGKEPLKEGDSLKVSLFHDKTKLISFTNYYWKKETYEYSLKKAGFKKIEWIKSKVTPDGIKKFGEKYWEYMINNPYLVIIKATK